MVAHAVADFFLQSDAMGKGKNRHKAPGCLPADQKLIPGWYYWLSAHALIHGGVVYIAMGSVLFGIFETVAHWLIDFAKCAKWINPNTDQLLHLACKLIYVAMFTLTTA
jgi:hypothetical protein